MPNIPHTFLERTAWRAHPPPLLQAEGRPGPQRQLQTCLHGRPSSSSSVVAPKVRAAQTVHQSRLLGSLVSRRRGSMAAQTRSREQRGAAGERCLLLPEAQRQQPEPQ